MGGDWNVLKRTINQGAKAGKLAGVGAVDVAAVIAAATPIVVAVTGLLVKLGLRKKEQRDELSQGIEEGKKMLEENQDVLKTAGVDVDESGSGVTVSRPTGEAETTETTGKNMLPIIIGAGALGVFLLMRKK